MRLAGAYIPVLPPLSVGEMTLRHYGALNYSQNSARDLSLRDKWSVNDFLVLPPSSVATPCLNASVSCLPVSANAINKGCRRAHEDISERQAPCGQPSPHRRKNCVSRNQAQTLAHERVTRQPSTLDGGSTERIQSVLPVSFHLLCPNGIAAHNETFSTFLRQHLAIASSKGTSAKYPFSAGPQSAAWSRQKCSGSYLRVL